MQHVEPLFRHDADPEIGFLTKSISKSHSRATAMPIAWALKNNNDKYVLSVQ